MRARTHYRRICYNSLNSNARAGGSPLVSIVIVNWNGKQFLKSCLSSLTNQTHKNHEIILVDNGSTDGSVDFVSKNFPEVKVVQNEVNIGAAAARNVGFKSSSGKYIAFIDNDVKVAPNWLRELVKVMKSDPTIGAAQSKLLFADERDKIWGAGEFVNFCGDYFIKGLGEKDNGQYTSIEEIFNPISAAMIIRREIFAEIGMFDPVFFIQHEDVDLGWRIWLTGYRVVFAPKSVAYHVVHGSGSARDFSSTKNLITMMTKNYSFKNLIKYVSVRIIIEFGTVIRLIYRRTPVRVHVAIAKAIVWNLINFRYIWKERLRVQHVLRRVSDEYLMERIMRKLTVPYVLVLLNLFPFGGRLLNHYNEHANLLGARRAIKSTYIQSVSNEADTSSNL